MALTREFLKGLGVEDEAIEKVMRERGIETSTQLDEVNKLRAEKLKLEGDVSKLQDDSKKYKDVETEKKELEEKLKQAQADYDKVKGEKESLESTSKEEVTKLKKDYAIAKAIAKTQTVDEVGYRAHLDMSKIQYDEEKDTLTGFEEQDKAIRENHKHLFKGGVATGGASGGLSDPRANGDLHSSIRDYYKGK